MKLDEYVKIKFSTVLGLWLTIVHLGSFGQEDISTGMTLNILVEEQLLRRVRHWIDGHNSQVLSLKQSHFNGLSRTGANVNNQPNK